MPRRQRLSDVQRSALVGVPTDPESLARYFTLDVRDLSLVRTKRGAHNRLGYAVQLAYLHFPGQALTAEASPPPELICFLAEQLDLPPALPAAPNAEGLTYFILPIVKRSLVAHTRIRAQPYDLCVKNLWVLAC